MLYTLSRQEVERLQDVSRGDLAELVRRCSLAVLNSGTTFDRLMAETMGEDKLHLTVREAY
jgi:hypothetical protein